MYYNLYLISLYFELMNFLGIFKEPYDVITL